MVRETTCAASSSPPQLLRSLPQALLPAGAGVRLVLPTGEERWIGSTTAAATELAVSTTDQCGKLVVVPSRALLCRGSHLLSWAAPLW